MFSLTILLMRALLVFLPLLCGLWLNPAQASSCSYWERQIRYADGGRQCLRDIPGFLHRKAPNRGASYVELIASSGHAALAVTKDPQKCPLAVGLITAQLAGTQSDTSIVGLPGDLALQRCTSELRASTQGAGCNCELVFDFDSSPLTQDEFRKRLALLDRQVTLGGRPLAQEEQLIKAAPVMASGSSPTIQEREMLLTQLETERAARIALEEKLAKELRKPAISEISPSITPQTVRQNVVPSMQRTERRVALVIGNSAYKINPLVNPTNDAADIAKALLDLRFETTLVQNASIADMRQATRKFADLIALSDVALIFYAGHGIEVRGRNFLLPINADVKHEFELEDQAYEAGRWLDMLESIKGANSQRVNIVILDACRDNAFSRGWRSAGRGLARMDAPTGTFVAFATAPGKVASDGEGQRNSPFTRGLLRVIQQPNLPIELMFKEVRRMVIEETRGEQVPWDNSSLIGNFSFKRSSP